MNNLIERLKTGKILICDGAMGSELHKKGLQPGDCPEEWNVTHQKDLQQIHSEYLKAGADIILSNTFGANRLKLATSNKENFLEKFNTLGVVNAKTAALSTPIFMEEKKVRYVFGDIGPTGHIMETSGGDLLFQDAVKVFSEQIEILVKAKFNDEVIIDAIIFETFEDLEELKAGILAAKELKIKIPIIASMTFHDGARGYKTIMGTSVKQAVQELEDTGVDIIGTNCGNGPEGVVEIIKMARLTNKKIPLLAEPNAGLPILKDGKTVFPLTPDAFADFGSKLLEAGASIIGGCCGTTPQHIKKLAEKIK